MREPARPDSLRAVPTVPPGTWTLVEPCCGSAALTLHLLGARRAILPYQGSKWRFRKELAALVERLGFAGPPGRVVLTDPGPWGRVIGVLLRREPRRALIGALEVLGRRDPGEVFAELQGGQVPQAEVRFAAEFLFLQRLSFSGKAVGTRDGRWLSPGFNKTSAYGIPATDRFGAVKPMIPSLIRALRGYDRALIEVDVDARCEGAAAPGEIDARTLVYLDPPYVESTRYPDGQMTRRQVEALAQAWAARGAAVVISEQHALALPGWKRLRLSSGRDDTSPFRGKQQEWVTYRAADPELDAGKPPKEGQPVAFELG